MPIYQIDNKGITSLERTTFAQHDLRERRDLQSLLKNHIEVISPDTLIVAEEFSDWEESRRRIDLLGIDKDANLVVLELKRTEDGGHMEFQAIRYAAMISTLTFERLVRIYEGYLQENKSDRDATESLLEFLEWSEPQEELFGKEVRIVLASGEFSRELTTSVMWLNEYGLDIRCVRMQPYASEDRLLLDVQIIIPVPEASDYQVSIREKKQEERESRKGRRGGAKFDLRIGDEWYRRQTRPQIIYRVVSAILSNHGTPQQIREALPWRSKLFKEFEGSLNAEQIELPAHRYFFCNKGEIFHHDGKTYVLSNQWKSLRAFYDLVERFPKLDIEILQGEFDLRIGGERHRGQTCPQIMYRVVSEILRKADGTPEEIEEVVKKAVPKRGGPVFQEFEGAQSEGAVQEPHRYFCGEGEAFRVGGNTYVLSKGWESPKAAHSLAETFPELDIHIEPAAEEQSENVP